MTDTTSASSAPAPTAAQASEVLNAQPLSRLLGARITAFGGGRATLEVPTGTEVRQQHGFTHGGLLCYLADNAVTFAAGSVLGPAVLTESLSVDYVRPAAGLLVRAEAHVVVTTRRRALCRCEIFDVSDNREIVVATAHGSVRLSPSVA